MVWKARNDGYGGLVYVLLGIAVLVAFVWAVATLVAVVLPSHPVAPDVNVVMGGTVTAAFGMIGVLIAKRDRNGNGNGRRDEERR